MVCEDKRSATLDAGNVKLTYNSLLEKAEAVEKEREKEKSRRIRKIENEIKTIWLDAGFSLKETWETAKSLVVEQDVYELYEKEERKVEDLWNSFNQESENTCSHHHSKSRKSKKNRKHKKKSRTRSLSVRLKFTIFIILVAHNYDICSSHQKDPSQSMKSPKRNEFLVRGP